MFDNFLVLLFPPLFCALGYYNTISQPISLSDIRRNVVEGNYNGSLTQFYCDVTLLLENGIAYNHENQGESWTFLNFVFESNCITFRNRCLPSLPMYLYFLTLSLLDAHSHTLPHTLCLPLLPSLSLTPSL